LQIGIHNISEFISEYQNEPKIVTFHRVTSEHVTLGIEKKHSTSKLNSNSKASFKPPAKKSWNNREMGLPVQNKGYTNSLHQVYDQMAYQPAYQGKCYSIDNAFLFEIINCNYFERL